YLRYEKLCGVAGFERPRGHDEHARGYEGEHQQAVRGRAHDRPGLLDLSHRVEAGGLEHERGERAGRRTHELRGEILEPRSDRLNNLRTEIHQVPSNRRRMSMNIGARAASP